MIFNAQLEGLGNDVYGVRMSISTYTRGVEYKVNTALICVVLALARLIEILNGT